MASIGYEPKLCSSARDSGDGCLEELLASLTADVETADQRRGANHGAMDGPIAGCGSCCICFSADFKAVPRWSFSYNRGDVSSEFLQWVTNHNDRAPCPFTVDVVEGNGAILDAGTMGKQGMSMSANSDSQESLAGQCGNDGILEDRKRGESPMGCSRTLVYSSWETQMSENAAIGMVLDTGLVESSSREEQASRPLIAGSLRDQTHDGVEAFRLDPLMRLIGEVRMSEECVVSGRSGRKPSEYRVDCCTALGSGIRVVDLKANQGEFKGSLGPQVLEEVLEALQPQPSVHASSGSSRFHTPDLFGDIGFSPQNPKQALCEPHYPGEPRESSGECSKPPVPSLLDAGDDGVPHHGPEELSESSGDRHVCPYAKGVPHHSPEELSESSGDGCVRFGENGVPHHGPKELSESSGDGRVCGRQEWSTNCPRETTKHLPRLAKLVSVEVGDKRYARTLPEASTGGLEDGLNRVLQSVQEDSLDFEFGSEESPGTVKRSRINPSGLYGLGTKLRGDVSLSQPVPEANTLSTKEQTPSEAKWDDKGGLERSLPQQVPQHPKEEGRNSSGCPEHNWSVSIDAGMHEAGGAISIQCAVKQEVQEPIATANTEQSVGRRTSFPPLPLRPPTPVTLVGNLSKVTPAWIQTARATQESVHTNTGDPVSSCRSNEGVIGPKSAQPSHLNPVGSFDLSPASEISPKSAQQSHPNPVGSFGLSPASEISPKSAQQSHPNPVGSFGLSPAPAISPKSAQPSHLNPRGLFGLDAPTLPVPNATNAASPSEMTGSIFRSQMHLPGWVQRLTENEPGDQASTGVTRFFPIPASRETGAGNACVWESKHYVVDSMPALVQRDECNLTNAGQYNEPLGFCPNLLKVDGETRMVETTQCNSHTEYYQIHSDEESDGSDQQQSAYDYLGDFNDLGCEHLSVFPRSLWPPLPAVQGVPLMLVRRESLGSLQARCWSLGRSFAEMPIGMTMSSCLLTLTSGPAPPRLLSAPSRPNMNVFLPIAFRSGYQVGNVPGQVGARWGESLYPEQNKNQKIAVSGEKEQSPDTNLKDALVVVPGVQKGQARLGQGNVGLSAKGSQRLTDPEVASEIPSPQPKEQVQDETSTSFVGPKPAWRSGVSCGASAPMPDVKTGGQSSGAQAGKEGMNQSVCLLPGNQDNEIRGGQVKDISPEARDRCVQSRMHVRSDVCVRKGAYKIRAGAACFRPGQKGAVCQATGIHPEAQDSGVQSRMHAHRAVGATAGATCQLGAYEVQAGPLCSGPEQVGAATLPGAHKVQAGSLSSVLNQAGTTPHLCANESQAGSLSPLPNHAELAPHPQAGLLGAVSHQPRELTQVSADKVQVSSLSTVLGQTGARQVQAGPSCPVPDPAGATCQSGAHQVQAGPSCPVPDPAGATGQSGAHQVQAGPSCPVPDPAGATCQSGAHQVQAGPSCPVPDPAGATGQSGAHQVQAGPSCPVPDPAGATCQSGAHQVQAGPSCPVPDPAGATGQSGAHQVQAGPSCPVPDPAGATCQSGAHQVQAGPSCPVPDPAGATGQSGAHQVQAGPSCPVPDPAGATCQSGAHQVQAGPSCSVPDPADTVCQSAVQQIQKGLRMNQSGATACLGADEVQAGLLSSLPGQTGVAGPKGTNKIQAGSVHPNTLVAEMRSKEPDSNLGSTDTAARPELVEPETVLSPAAVRLHSHESGPVPVSFTPLQEQPALIPHDHPLKLAIMITAASTLENVCVLRLRLVQTGLPEYIWQKYSGGHFKIQHNQFHKQAEVGVGNWVLSQAAAQLQPRIVSVYQDTEQLGAFMEAVIVDLRDDGKYPEPGKEVIRENLFKMLKHIHRMNTIASQVRSLYGCFDWKLRGEEYDYTLSSLLPPRSFFEAPESNKPEDKDRWLLLEDGVPFVQAQPAPTDQLQPVMQEPSEQAVSPAQVASPPGEAPGVSMIPDGSPHEKARERPFNDLQFRAWSCLFNNNGFERAVGQQALLSCCTYFGSVHSMQQPSDICARSFQGYRFGA